MFFSFFLILYTCSIFFKITNFFRKNGIDSIDWSKTKYDFWQGGGLVSQFLIFSDKGGRRDEQISDFWLTRRGGGSGPSLFLVDIIYEQPLIWSLKLCLRSMCGARSAWLPTMCGAKSALLPSICGANLQTHMCGAHGREPYRLCSAHRAET